MSPNQQLDELLNPFASNTRPYRLFKALMDGKKSADELVKLNVVKRHRRVSDIAGLCNQLDGIKIVFHGDDIHAADTIWELKIVNSNTKLFRQTATPAAPPPIQVQPFTSNAPTKIGKYLPPPDYPYIKSSADLGSNVFLVGNTGSGKTAMVKNLAKDTGRSLFRQNFNGETTVENLIGCTKIANDEGVSVTSWKDGVLSEACRRAARGERVLYYPDEVTAGKPEVLFQFNRVLELNEDGTRSIEIEGDQIDIPAGNLAIVGASNTFRQDETGQWQGTNAMNMSFANRWVGGVFYVDYAPNEDEILMEHGVDERLAKALRRMALEIRAKAKEEAYPVVCSTRDLLSIGSRAKMWGVFKALEFCYLNKLTADERNRIVDPVVTSLAWPK